MVRRKLFEALGVHLIEDMLDGALKGLYGVRHLGERKSGDFYAAFGWEDWHRNEANEARNLHHITCAVR